MDALPKKYYANAIIDTWLEHKRRGGKKVLLQSFLSGSPPPTYIPSTPPLPVFGGTRILFIPSQQSNVEDSFHKEMAHN